MERLAKEKAGMAAFSSSQALFDALREGVTDLDQHLQQLKDARDTIKNAHFAVDRTAFGTARDSIIKHWMSTLKVHEAIFQEVVNISQPSPGTEPDVTNEGLGILLEAVQEATKIGVNTVCYIKESLQDSNETENSTSDSAESIASGGRSASPENLTSSQTPMKKRKAEKNGKSVALPINSPEAVPIKAEMHEDDPPDVVSSRKKHKTKAKKRSDVLPEGSPHPMAADAQDIANDDHVMFEDLISSRIDHVSSMPPPPVPSFPTKERKASTEDISAEVDARLKAKEEKRARKKEAKKRKRESIASSILESPHSDVFPESTPSHTTEAKQQKGNHDSKLERPPKKRSKVDLLPEINGERAFGQFDTSKSTKTIFSDEDLNSSLTNGKKAASTPVSSSLPAAEKPEKLKKSKRRRSSDGFDGQGSALQHGHHGDGEGRKIKKAKKAKTG
ncbi:hypothetical protein BDV97DRAFT_401571 [Delphinella strobiligena]|nr:hypothetical protein BDV97DRAFT_401571 [Delphinella strobiligena]